MRDHVGFWLRSLAFVLLASLSLLAGDVPQFPSGGLLPKGDIGATRFLEKFPEYDGRGTVVAILDTGVDPGAEGLQTTPDGRPKVIDIIDGTGSGDVDTSIVRKPANGVLEGLTGRKLKLPANPAAEYRVGIKRGWDLVPEELEERLKRVRREAWDKAHAAAELELRRKLETEATGEMQARLEVLKTLAAQYDDPGPVHDCVVYHDGQVWRAIVDTDEDGDLAEEQALTDFDRERKWGTFGSEDRLNFGVHIDEDGKRLSIVTDCGAHGTHVAGIVAGHYPGQPERNGIAPGAQIVSVKIGDLRVGTMETGLALLRATSALVRHKCDLANMSFGEPTIRANQGLVVSALSELVHKQNLIFVSSAMNSGPALTTVGAPGGEADGIIGVGAYLSPEMMAAQYSLREKLPPTAYTFTSRGPARDGDPGVAIFAPGGAVAPVPQWTLHRSLQMNGTSMASPNACGGLALIISALKAKQVPYSPVTVRRAIQNTAQPVDGVEPFAQGPGLLQVDRAWDYLQAHAKDPAERVRLAVATSSRPRGIYLRSASEVNVPKSYQVFISPKFPKDPQDPKHAQELAFDLSLTLVSTKPWATVGPSLHLSSAGRNFEIHVDPTQLKPGDHYAEVQGLDASRPDRGPLFRVPVTVLKPAPLTAAGTKKALKGRYEFHPGQLARQFVSVPARATTATIELKRVSTGGRDEPVRIRVDAAQVPVSRRFEVHSIAADLGEPHKESFAVTGGEMLELCFVREWRTLAGWTEPFGTPAGFEYELTFDSLAISKTELALTAEGPGEEVRLTAGSRPEKLSPAASLTTRRQVVRPSRTTLKPLPGERNTILEGRPLHELVLEFSFDQPSAGMVTPQFPLLDNLLYDSDYGALLWMLFDASKQRVAADDVYPGPVSLKAGKHVLRLQLIHPDAGHLEKLRNVWLALDRPNSVGLTIVRQRPSGPDLPAGFGSPELAPGETATAWVLPPTSFGSGVPGETLHGTIRWTESGPSYPVVVPVPGTPAAASAATPAPIPLLPERAPGTAGRLADELLEFRIRQLQSLNVDSDKEIFEQLSADLLKEHPDLLAVHLARLHRLDDDPEKREFRLEAIVEAADAVLSRIDAKAIQANFGANVLPEDSAGQKERQKFSEQRKILIDTLYRKGRALGYMDLPEVVARKPVADPAALEKAFEANFAELRRWVDTTDRAYFLLHVRRERRQKHPAQALQLLLRHFDELPANREYAEKRPELMEEIGWTFQTEYERRWIMIRFPASDQPF